MLGEATDRVEEGDERADETLEDFRQEVRAEGSDEWEDESPSGERGLEGADGGEEAAPAGEGGRDESAADPSDEDLEGFRQQILEEEEPELPGEDAPDGQPHEQVEGTDEDVPRGRESTEAQEGETEKQDGQEVSDSKEETTTTDSEETPSRMEEPDSTQGGSEEVAAVDPPNPDSQESTDKVEDNDLEPKDLEEFRERILEEYGPEGLGEDTPEGQLYDLAREEMEGGRGSSGPDEVDESDKVEGVADSADAPEAVADSFEAIVADEVGKEAQDPPSQAEPDVQGADGGLVAEFEVEEGTQDEPESMKRIVEELGPEGPSGGIPGEHLDGLTGAESLDSHQEGPPEEAGDSKRGETHENQPTPLSPDDGATSDGASRPLASESGEGVAEAKEPDGAEPAEIRKEPWAEDFQPLLKLDELDAAANQPEKSGMETEQSEPKSARDEALSGEPEIDRLVVVPRAADSDPMACLEREANDQAGSPDLSPDARVAVPHLEPARFHEPLVPNQTPLEDMQVPVSSGNLSVALGKEKVNVGDGSPRNDIARASTDGDSSWQEKLASRQAGGDVRYDAQVVIAGHESELRKPDIASTSNRKSQIPIAEQENGKGASALPTSEMEGRNPHLSQADSAERQVLGVHGGSKDQSLPLETLSRSVPHSKSRPEIVEMGRYSREGNQLLVSRENEAGRAEPSADGRKREQENESVDAVRRVVEHMGSPMLIVPGSRFPDGMRKDVMEVTIAREKEGWKEYFLYCRHAPRAGHTYLDLRHTGAEVGEGFKIVSVKAFRLESFEDSYNENPPRGLENTRLVERGRFLSLAVGTEESKLSDVVLRTREGKAVLDGKLGGAGFVKVAKSHDGFDFRLKDHSRVTEIRATSEGVKLSYQRTDHDPYPHWRIVSGFQARLGAGDQARERLSAGEIRLVPESEGEPKMFRVLISEERRETVRKILRETTTLDEYRKSKGDLAEEIVKDLLPELGMTMVADHPFNSDPLKTRSERTGPDLLVSMGDKKTLCYVEVKWWGSIREALERGERQVASDLRRFSKFDDSVVTEGYVVALDWNPDKDETFLRVKRVKVKGT